MITANEPNQITNIFHLRIFDLRLFIWEDVIKYSNKLLRGRNIAPRLAYSSYCNEVQNGILKRFKKGSECRVLFSEPLCLLAFSNC